MNWFKSLFAPKPDISTGNFSEHWLVQPSVPLEFDLQAGALNGVGIGDPASGLSFLGRAEGIGTIGRVEGIVYLLLYPGFTVDLTAGRVTSYSLNISQDALDIAEAEDDEPFVAFPGRFMFGLRRVNWGAHTTDSDVVALLGEPAKRYDSMEDPEDEEPEPYLYFYYDLRGCKCEISFYERRLTGIQVDQPE